jgi:prophage antirepressor-like protein
MCTAQSSNLAVYEGKHIRKILHQGEWWFSINDVINVLVGGDRPRKYWNDLKKKQLQEGYDQLFEKNG